MGHYENVQLKIVHLNLLQCYTIATCLRKSEERVATGSSCYRLDGRTIFNLGIIVRDFKESSSVPCT